MENKKKITEKLLISGAIFILVGTVLLLLSTGILTGKKLIIPVFMIFLGFYLLYIGFFKHKKEIRILPGMFFTLIGIYGILLASNVLETGELRKIWPIFMLIAGVSLVPYGFKTKKEGRIKIFIPSAAIVILSLVFLMFSLKLFTGFNSFVVVWWPSLLVIMGIALVTAYFIKLSRYKKK